MNKDTTTTKKKIQMFRKMVRRQKVKRYEEKRRKKCQERIQLCMCSKICSTLRVNQTERKQERITLKIKIKIKSHVISNFMQISWTQPSHIGAGCTMFIDTMVRVHPNQRPQEMFLVHDLMKDVVLSSLYFFWEKFVKMVQNLV